MWHVDLQRARNDAEPLRMLCTPTQIVFQNAIMGNNRVGPPTSIPTPNLGWQIIPCLASLGFIPSPSSREEAASASSTPQHPSSSVHIGSVNPGPGVLGLRIFKMASFFRLKRSIELTLLSAKPIPDFFSRTNETHEISLSLFFSRKGVGFANQKKNLGSSFANQKETHIDSPH
jgi:hypothetical protein